MAYGGSHSKGQKAYARNEKQRIRKLLSQQRREKAAKGKLKDEEIVEYKGAPLRGRSYDFKFEEMKPYKSPVRMVPKGTLAKRKAAAVKKRFKKNKK